MKHRLLLFVLLCPMLHAIPIVVDDVLISHDHKIYILSHLGRGTREFDTIILSRFNPEGALDTCYGNDGHLLIHKIAPSLHNIHRQYLAQCPITHDILIAGNAIQEPENLSPDSGFSSIIQRLNNERSYKSYLTRVSEDGARIPEFNSSHFKFNRSSGKTLSGISVGPDGEILLLRDLLNHTIVTELTRNGKILKIGNKTTSTYFNDKDISCVLTSESVRKSSSGKIAISGCGFPIEDLEIEFPGGEGNQIISVPIFGSEGKLKVVTSGFADLTLERPIAPRDGATEDYWKAGLVTTRLVQNPKTGENFLILLTINHKLHATIRMLDPNLSALNRPFGLKVVTELTPIFAGSNGGYFINTNAQGETVLIGRNAANRSRLAAVTFNFEGDSTITPLQGIRPNRSVHHNNVCQIILSKKL